MAGDLGAWEPFTVAEVVALMGVTDGFWWLSGGCGIDWWLGRATRPHGDIDVSIRRSDVELVVHDLAPRLELHVARDGRLWELDAASAAADESIHGLWGRARDGGPWRVQVNLEPFAGDEWVYRRDPRVSRSTADVVQVRDGVPCVRPEVQLLWKAAEPTAKDEIDLVNVWPALRADDRAWLAASVALAHPGSPWGARMPPDPTR